MKLRGSVFRLQNKTQVNKKRKLAKLQILSIHITVDISSLNLLRPKETDCSNVVDAEIPKSTLLFPLTCLSLEMMKLSKSPFFFRATLRFL